MFTARTQGQLGQLKDNCCTILVLNLSVQSVPDASFLITHQSASSKLELTLLPCTTWSFPDKSGIPLLMGGQREFSRQWLK